MKHNLFTLDEVSSFLNNTKNALSGGATAIKIATQLVNVVSSKSSRGFATSVSGKIFALIKFLNISYPYDLEIALKTWNTNFLTLGFNIEAPEAWSEKVNNENVPDIFGKFYVSSNFLINLWSNLIVALSLVFGFLILYLFEWLSKKESLFKFRASYQNFLWAQNYSLYGDLVYYTIIEYESIHFDWSLSFISFIIGVVLLVCLFGSFYFHLRLIYRYQQARKNNDPEVLKNLVRRNEDSSVLFGDFKDDSFLSNLFFFGFS